MAGAWTSFAALGDSFTEGLDDPYPQAGSAGSAGSALAYRGWADLVAAELAASRPGFRYANLAIRGRNLDAVVADQVPTAVALAPDLVSIAAGGNDVLRPRFDPAPLGALMAGALADLVATGATVLAFAGFRPLRLPFGGTVATRAEAYNDLVREAAERTGALLVDMWNMPELGDPRMWSSDRIHLSPRGHEHVAGAVLTALAEPVTFAWPVVGDPAPALSGLAARRADASWGREFLLPWLGRRVRGRSSGDGLAGKRTTLQAWEDAGR